MNLPQAKTREQVKHGLRNILVDVASVIIFLAASYTVIGGLTMLYSEYYITLKMPSPESFSSASTSFAGAIGLIYMLTLTRKHRLSKEEKDEK